MPTNSEHESKHSKLPTPLPLNLMEPPNALHKGKWSRLPRLSIAGF